MSYALDHSLTSGSDMHKRVRDPEHSSLFSSAHTTGDTLPPPHHAPYGTLAMKPGESNSSAEKKGVPQPVIGEHVTRFSHSPLTDEVEALARKVFLKFDLVLVLPTLIMFCKYQSK